MRPIFAIILLSVSLAALAMYAGRSVEADLHARAQSWDQENLKRNDHGCPTAIYIAPNGVLEQCP